MNGENETRDRDLGRLLEQIEVPQISPSGFAKLARASLADAPARIGPRRKWWLALVATVGALGVALALVLALRNSSSPPSPNSSVVGARPGGTETDVRTLLAFRRAVNERSNNSLPPTVHEVLARFASRNHESPTTIAEPITGPPSIYLITFKPNQLCEVVALSGAVWECRVTLRQAGGSLSVAQAIVDGQRFVYGLAANDVTSITVTSPASSTTAATSEQAQLANNAFVASLPYHGGFGLSGVTVTANRSDGSTGTASLRGIPEPPGPPLINPATGAPSGADASKKTVLITSANVTLWTAPRSDANGYCVWTSQTGTSPGGLMSNCDLPRPAQSELGLGLLGTTTLVGRVRDNVASVKVQLANGNTTTLKPTDSWVLLGGIPTSALPLTATAYDSTGSPLATETLGNHRPGP
jgi:hypothetical protein